MSQRTDLTKIKEHPLISIIQDNEESLAKALPEHIGKDRFMRITLSSIRQNPALLDCDPASMLSALLKCASVGLEPGSVRDRCYLIAYKNQVEFQMGYKGWIKLYLDAGAADVWFGVIYKTEIDSGRFKYIKGQRPHHEPDIQNLTLEDSEVVGSYFVIEMQADHRGAFFCEVSGLKEINRARASSKRKTPGGPWDKAYQDMCIKTAAVRISKQFQFDRDEDRITTALEVEFDGADMRQLDSPPPATNGSGIGALKARHGKGNGKTVDAKSETVPKKFACTSHVFQGKDFEFEKAEEDPMPTGPDCVGPCGKPDVWDEDGKTYTCSSGPEDCERASNYASQIEHGKAEHDQATLPTEETEPDSDSVCPHGKRKLIKGKAKTGKNKGQPYAMFVCTLPKDDPNQCEPNFVSPETE